MSMILTMVPRLDLRGYGSGKLTCVADGVPGFNRGIKSWSNATPGNNGNRGLTVESDGGFLAQGCITAPLDCLLRTSAVGAAAPVLSQSKWIVLTALLKFQ